MTTEAITGTYVLHEQVFPCQLVDDTIKTFYNVFIVGWEIEVTDQFAEWWRDLDDGDQEAITAAANVLEDRGPALGRPLADNVHQSRHQNMKELIPPASDIRVFFAFDPRRMAIFLIGGDKGGEWNAWYDRMVPIADNLYDEHLRELEREGSPNA